MSYPFYIHAATSSTASQHPCRLFFAAAAVAAPFILFSNNAYAALNCTTQPTCEQLGYSKSVDANCDDYILCPFDTSYKKCVASDFCAGYTLSSCPTGANCSSCGKDDDLKFKVDSCKSGYTYANDTCKANSCTGYTLTKCPGNGYCDDCLSGSTTKYKLTGCKSGYTLSGNSCIAATCSGYTYTTCPYNATRCAECLSGTTKKYKILSCESKYTLCSYQCVQTYSRCEDQGPNFYSSRQPGRTCYSVPTKGKNCQDLTCYGCIAN